MIKPVKNLHGLSPVEDWIQHSQYVEQQRDALTERIGYLKIRMSQIIGCFDAAEFEGLNNRLNDGTIATGLGSLKDLVERRLLPVKDIAAEALADDDKETL